MPPLRTAPTRSLSVRARLLNVAKAQAFGVSPERILPIWDWVGGRYSLWSSVGFVIAAVGFFLDLNVPLIVIGLVVAVGGALVGGIPTGLQSAVSDQLTMLLVALGGLSVVSSCRSVNWPLNEVPSALGANTCRRAPCGRA